MIYLSQVKTKTYILKQNKKVNNIRYMLTTVRRTPHTINPKLILKPPQRAYPGDFRVGRWKKMSVDEQRRLGLTNHEMTHDSIQDAKTGKIEAIFTSCQNKGNKIPSGFDKVSEIKLNGTYTPLKDLETKKPILDKDGKTIPDPKVGGQYMATLGKPRKFGKDVQNKFVISTEEKDQVYLDKHEAKIHNNILKHRRLGLSKKIGGADEE